MSDICHHIDETSLTAFAAGQLGYPFAMVVASHLSLCPACRGRLSEQFRLAGAVLDGLEEQSVGADVKAGLMDRLDDPIPEPEAIAEMPAPFQRPLSQFFGSRGPKWAPIGLSARQSILWEGAEGSLRLLHIPAGRAVPDHGHGGLEYTLVLQGSYEAAGTRYGAGDVEIADQDTEHTPVAGPEMPCICLAATNAPLRFSSVIPRLLQPLLRI